MKKSDIILIIIALCGIFIAFLQLVQGIENTPDKTQQIGLLERINDLIIKNILWIIIFFCVALIFWWVLRKRNNHLKRKIALFLPRSKRAGFFWDKFEYFVHEFLMEKGYECLSAHTDKEYNTLIQRERLENFDWKKRKVDGAIVAPAGPKVLISVENVINNKQVNLVLHDVTHEDIDNFFSQKKMSAPFHVNIDNYEGGHLAASIMFRKLTNKIISLPYHILIIPGNTNHTHSNKRVEGFHQEFRKLAKQIIIHYTEDGRWNRKECARMFKNYIDSTLPKLSIQKIHGIFACNDEMAITANKVIDNIIKENHPCCSILADTIIVGFDATDEMMEEIKDQNSRIVGTINAKIQEQAKKVVNLILDLIKNKKKIKLLETMTPSELRDFLTVKPESIEQ